MIYRMLKHVSSLFMGALMMLAVLWSWPGAMAFPVSTNAGRTSAHVVQDAVAATQVLHYQGRLLDAVSGQPKPDGAYVFTFRIYTTATGGAPLWTESKSITANKGLFSTLLGDLTPLNLALFNGQELYLGITIGTDPEAAPRQRLAHVAYALHAEDANKLNGAPASAFAPSNHTHDGAAITSGMVASSVIDPAVARDNEVMSLLLASDGSGSTLDADTVDGLDAGAFALQTHNHDTRYYVRQLGTQFTRTLGAGQSETVFTHSWPEAWYVQWSLRPTSTGGRIQWNGWIERGSNGLLTYWFQVTNNGTITTDYTATYAVLQ